MKVEKELLSNIVLDWNLIEFRIVLMCANFNSIEFLTKKGIPASVLMPIVWTD